MVRVSVAPFGRFDTRQVRQNGKRRTVIVHTFVDCSEPPNLAENGGRLFVVIWIVGGVVSGLHRVIAVFDSAWIAMGRIMRKHALPHFGFTCHGVQHSLKPTTRHLV